MYAVSALAFQKIKALFDPLGREYAYRILLFSFYMKSCSFPLKGEKNPLSLDACIQSAAFRLIITPKLDDELQAP